MNPLIKTKNYPLNYSDEVVDVIAMMSISNSSQIVGSMALKSQQYSGDYDLIEIVNEKYKSKDTALNAYVKTFQSKIIKMLDTKDIYIGDIKAGLVEDWIVIPEKAQIKNGRIINFNKMESLKKLDTLKKDNVITGDEYNYTKKMLSKKLTIDTFLQMKKEIRFHIVRWTPEEVLKGVVVLRNKKKMTLKEAFSSNSVIKLDIVAYINGRFSDFSNIYILKYNGIPINNVDLNEQSSIKQDLMYFLSSDNYYKAFKRLFSLVRKEGVGNGSQQGDLLQKLTTMFNSDLGRLYLLKTDIETLIFLLDNFKNISPEKLRYELNQFRVRLGNIYSIDKVGTDKELESLKKLTQLPTLTAGLKNKLELLREKYTTILNKETLNYAEENSLLPIPSKYKA